MLFLFMEYEMVACKETSHVREKLSETVKFTNFDNTVIDFDKNSSISDV